MPGVCGYQAPDMFLTFKYKLQPKQKQHMVLLDKARAVMAKARGEGTDR